jgi:hypothetical protein
MISNAARAAAAAAIVTAADNVRRIRCAGLSAPGWVGVIR